MKGLLVIVLAALLPAFVQWRLQPPTAFRARTSESGELVSLATVRSWPRDVVWIDARPRAEFEAGHVPGAVLLNEDSFDALLPGLLAQWQPGRPVVVYCSASCESSRRIALRLRVVGIEDVHVLEGGWDSAKALQP